MVLEPRILLDASLVDTTSIEADPEQPTDLRFDVPGTRVLDPRVLDPRLSDPQDPSTQRMITPDLPTIRNWLDTANTHNARLSIIVKLWDAQPEDRISLAETYTSSSVLRDTWDDARGELRLEPRAGAASPAVAEAFLDALQALQLEASGAEDVSTREVWVFPTLAGTSEVAYRVERSSGMVRHYVLDASLESYADARKTAEQQRFFGVDGYLGHFSSDAEKSLYGSMAEGRPVWLGLSDRENVGVWKVSSGPKQGQVFWRETDAGVGIYGSGSPGSGWGDADWEKLWGTNDFPRRVSLGSGFPVALLSGDDAEVSSSEDSKGARIVHHDLLLSSGGFFAREVRIPDTSSASGGRSDADTGDAAEVAPEKEVLVRKTRASLSRQTRQSPPSSDPPVLDVSGLGGVKVRMQQRLVLTDGHLSATDADTVLSPGVVDPAKITFRISAITGGKLQRLSSSGAWEDMTPETGQAYYAFTFADLQAGKVAFLAGDGRQAGEGEQITFKVQAADDDNNESDSDDATPGDQPADGTIAVDRAVAATAGVGGLINTDGALTPDTTTLGLWKGGASGRKGTLHVIVRLLDVQEWDVLSLATGYDASKVTPRWDQDKGELSLEIASGATTADIQTALGTLSLAAEPSGSASVRQVWVFPIFSGVRRFAYRVDETAGLVRYYHYDLANLSVPDGIEEASKRTLFGKKGYFGMYLSNLEKETYRSIVEDTSYLPISDGSLGSIHTTEGKWVILAGPRAGQLFFDEGTKKYGPGAEGSGWSKPKHFWRKGQPYGGATQDVVFLSRNDFMPYDYTAKYTSGSSKGKPRRANTVTHFDFWLSDGEIWMRPVEVAESPPNPVLRVDFDGSQATALRPLILTEHHLSVKDVDTRDPSDATKVDASEIKFRITNIAHGTLHERADTGTSTPWTKIVADGSNAYLEFTLAQLQGGLVAFVPDASASPLTFQVQAADDGDGTPGSLPHLSDSDPYDPGAQPKSVSVSVVALRTVAAGEEVPINGDGVLTPDDGTLDAWLTADDALEIFVFLREGRSGIFKPSAGLVQERLSVGTHSVSDSKIVVSWDADNWRLSLAAASSGSATRADFQEVLNALQLQTVPFGQVSHRTISVQPDTSDMLVAVARTGYYRRGLEVSASAPNPILEVDSDGLRVDPGQRFVLMEKHILVYDPDTQDGDGNVDPSRISFRITGLTGGTLQKLSSDDPPVWRDISPSGTGPNQYREFTLAELRAGKIAFLAGDGLVSGGGTKIAFKVQAADNAGNLSDSDPQTPDKDPVGTDIVVVPAAKATAGFRESLNADGALTPDTATLTAWKGSTVSGGLAVVVKLFGQESGDVLSLGAGYDASKVTPRWDQDKGELSLEIASGATEADIQAALGFLEFESALSDSVGTRKVWVFPTLSGVSGFRYRADESAGLVRYYFYDSTGRTFSVASTEAAGRSLFGKSGYLGVFTSNAERNIYKALRQYDMHLAISDDTQLGTTEGKWVITAGPRQDQVLWDHTLNPKAFGSGASGSGWSVRSDFWYGGNPDNWRDGEDYPIMRSDGLVKDGDDGSRRSVSHHDLWLSEGEIFARLVEVAESPPNPVLRVDFKFQVTAQRPLILTQDHISVDDLDTRDVNDNVDASRIKFRITGLTGGALQRRSSSSASDWKDIVADGAYLAFTLADLQGGLVAFVPDASASTLAFDIQAHDGTHLSDSDRSTSDPDPESVSVSVVALKEIDAGKEMPVNDDRRATSGDGALTSSSATLDAWISAAASNWISVAASNPRVLVRIEGTKRGETLFLEDGHDIASITSITSSWSWDSFTRIGILSLQSDGTATVDDFQAVLNALALRTVRSGSASIRTISVRPDMAAEVPQKDHYARDVLIRESGPRPYIGERKTAFLKFGQDDRAILSPSEFLVEDFDTSASDVTIVMRELSAGATLQKRNAVSGVYRDIEPESDGSLEFTLKELQEGLMAIHLASPLGKKVSFELEARDSDGNWNDVGRSNSKSNTDQRGVREFELTGVLALSPEELETDLETGYQRAVPFGGLEQLIEEARSDGSRAGALHIVLENGVSGDRLEMRKSVSGVRGRSHGGHRYTLTVSHVATTSARIDEALAQIYYRAREAAGEKERELVVRWATTSAETVLFAVPLANRPPVLRNWGIAARYHDITPAPNGAETSLDLGYHPYREYMPEVLDNEGEVVRLEVVLVDKAGGMLSPDERVFLSQELLGQLQVQDLVLRDLRSSDKKARALVLESADGRTLVSPEFMSRILQGLLYRHGAAGRDVDVGERREISVAVFDGEAYSQTRTMEVRLVDKTPDPSKYVNTFIGTAKQSGMGVSSGTGNADNEAGMTFPGAAYPFGAVRLTPDTGQGHAYGGYRHDKSLSKTQFVVTAFSGPGCPASEGGDFTVGVDNTQTKNADKSSQVSEAGYYKVLLRGGGEQVVLEAAASSPRTATMRLTYQSDGLTGFVSLPGSIQLSEQNDRWVVTYNTSEEGVCGGNDSTFYVGMHIGKHQVSAVTRIGRYVKFTLKQDQLSVDIKVSMSYVSRAGASHNIDVENPGWNDFAVEKEKAKKAWNYYLSKVAIDEFEDSGHSKGNAGDKWSIFYSALYRSLLHMNTASDVDGNYMGIGRVSKNVSEAPSYGYRAEAGTEGPPPKVYFYNFSGWDAYRSQMALVGLMAPALSQDMAISLLESGYVNGTTSHKDNYIVDREIPRWVTGYQETGVMPGDSGPPSVSSLFMFGSRSVSLTSMLEVLDRSSRHARSSSRDGHHILEGVASDAAIAQMALWMSQQDSLPQAVREKARRLYAYARGRTNRAWSLMDSQGYVRPKLWGGDASPKSKHYGELAEGNSIQYTFMILHDVLGLKRRIDGGETSNTALWRNLIKNPGGGSVPAYRDLFQLSQNEGLARWDEGERSMALRFLTHFLKPNEGKSSWYGFMGNEVAHSSPFLANWFEPHLTQNAARRISLFGFRNTAAGLFGNDDLGATSAWYVWTAMGIYPAIPGVGGVTVIPPRFEHVEISVPGGKSVQLRSSSGRAEDAYIQSVRRDGRETSSLWLTSSELLRGVKLDFRVGSSKSGWGEDASDSPPSYGDTESGTPVGYRSIWREEGDDATGASSHSAFDGSRNTAWRFSSETDGSKVLEVDFTSAYAASGLLLRHADVGRTSTLNSDLGNVTVSVAVKGSDGSWSDVAVTRTDPDHDMRRMLLDFGAREMEIRGLRLTFTGLDADEEHGIYEVLAKDGSVVEAARLRSRRSLLEGSLGDDVGWVQLSSKPALFVHGLHEQVQVTAGRVLVLREGHILVYDADTRVSATGDLDAARIKFRVRDLAGGALQERTSLSDPWAAKARDVGSPADAPVYSFSLADLRAGKIGFLAGDGTNPITFTIQAEDDQGNLSDSDSDNSGEQPASVRIPVVGLVKVIIGETSSVNSDGVLTPLEATLNRWRGAAGALTILVELHRGSSTEELLLGSGHGVASITSSWIWDVQSGIGTLSLEDSGSASASDFRSVLSFLQLRSAVASSDSYRRILVRPDISGSAFRKDFHVREVKVYVNDAPQAPPSGLADQTVAEHATVTYQVPAFTDDEDTELEYEAKLVVAGSEQALPGDWIEFDEATRTFTFTPEAITHVGSHTLRVRGTDSGGLWVEEEFKLEVSAVNDAPKASEVPEQLVDEEATVTYVVPAFTDEEDDAASVSLTYTFSVVRVEDDDSLTPVSGPEIGWIDFDDDASSLTFRTFTFTPTASSDAGTYKVRVTATDRGINGVLSTKRSAFEEFEVVVVAVNDAPEASEVPEQTVDEDATVTYVVPAFTDEEDDTTSAPFTYEAKRVVVDQDGAEILSDIPDDWIKFDADSSSATFRTFTFTPSAGHVGVYTLRVTGTDSGKLSASVEFKVTVAEVNDAPEAPPAGLDKHVVDEDATVTYQVPAFTDEEDDAAGMPLTYTFEVVRVEDDDSETPISAPYWITFVGTTRTFTFAPKASSDAGRYTLRVVATDAGIGDDPDTKKSDSADFILEVLDFNDAPVASSLQDQQVDEDTTATYRFKAFTDEEEDKASRSLAYTSFWAARDSTGRDIVDGDGEKTFVSLPTWIVFDGLKRRFTFEPHRSSDAGRYTLRVVGTDEGHWRRPGHQEERLCGFYSRGFGFQRRPGCELSARPAGR